jgi:hypothetical protein
MREELLKLFPSLLLYCDMEPSEWDVRRGLQHITEKTAAERT